MSFTYTSERTSAFAQAIVIADLMERGWACVGFEGRPYDIVCDRGNESGRFLFETLQVKRLQNDRILSLKNRPHHEAGSNDLRKRKERAYFYADAGIDWMVGVTFAPVAVYYYPLEVYRAHGIELDIRDVPPVDFPRNANIKAPRRAPLPGTIDDEPSLNWASIA